ncbi:hypothetical protein ACXXDK_00280 [Deinococcus sp. PESE-38]
MTGPASSWLPAWPSGLPRPERRDRWPAQRIAVGVGAPLLLLLALGRADLTVYAAFGAFTGIYAGANRSASGHGIRASRACCS